MPSIELIYLKVALERATFTSACIHVSVVYAAMLREFISSVEGFLADITVEGLAGFLAQMRCLVLLQQEVEVEFLCTVIAVPLGIV
jgi:hypothetical protein